MPADPLDPSEPRAVDDLAACVRRYVGLFDELGLVRPSTAGIDVRAALAAVLLARHDHGPADPGACPLCAEVATYLRASAMAVLARSLVNEQPDKLGLLVRELHRQVGRSFLRLRAALEATDAAG